VPPYEPRYAPDYGTAIPQGPNADLHEPPVPTPPGRLAEEIVGEDAVRSDRDVTSNPRQPDPRPAGMPADCALSLPRAIAIALRQNPQLSVVRAEIDKAAAGEEIAFSAFLPQMGVVNTLGAHNVEFGESSTPSLQPFTPFHWTSRYNQVELETQWIIWDFGRRTSDYRQAEILVEIAQLRYQRACQTVAYDTTEAYFRVLLAYSTEVTARDALRRANEYLRVSGNLFEQGKVDRESLYSAELQVAKARQRCISARANVNTATAHLNLTMGQSTTCFPRVNSIRTEPKFNADLLQCLRLAASRRREIRIVSDWVAKTNEATVGARADFMPKVVSNAAYSSTSGDLDSDVTCGGIAVAWDIYAGGKRIGAVHEQQANTCRAIAKGRQVCDRIAFEVNFAYQKVEDASKRIDLARSAVQFATEKLRIIMNKFEQGEASPTDVVDAQTSLTASEQQYADTIFELRLAIARLHYAMGVSER